MNLRFLLLASAVLRFFLIFYGEWQDAHMEVRYTDVDYIVFSDAASLVVAGKSPYDRSTYRYSPLLAYLLVPNSVLHPSWGKFIFSAADLLVGLFLHTILKQRHVPEKLQLYSIATWLFNPFTFTIGTRGNCEPVVCAMVLWVMISLMNGEVFRAAVWYGLLVHFRIYPIIYSVPIILVLDSRYFGCGQKPTLANWCPSKQQEFNSSKAKPVNPSNAFRRLICCPWVLFKSMLTRERILFGFISGFVFFSCTALFFYLYGYDFVNEALMYHLTRTDPRHNFSIYFYHIYLHHEEGFSVIEKLISFLPQLMVQLILSLSFAQDIPFCLFVQTVAFVAFNKVITAQYFVWFFCLLPLILPWSSMKLRWKGFTCILLWVGAQIHWLMWGYLLEFKGKNVFIPLWLASIFFLAANTWVLIMVIRHHRFSAIFIQSRVTDSACSKKVD